MSPDGQRPPYYYDSNTIGQDAQTTYGSYQPRSNQYGQHARQTSSTPAQSFDYQQPTYDNDQAQQNYNGQGYHADVGDSGQWAAETLSRMQVGSSTPTYLTTSATTYNQTQTTNTYNNARPNHLLSPQYSSSSTIQSQGLSHPTQNNYRTAQTKQARSSSINSVRSNMARARSPITGPVQHPQVNSGAQYSDTRMSIVQQRPESSTQIQASHQRQRVADQEWQEAPQTMAQTNEHAFIDPSVVYDPWHEYQRKLAAAQGEKEAEDRATAKLDAEGEQGAEESTKEQDEENQRKELEAKENKKAEARRKADAHVRQLMAMVKQVKDKHPDLLTRVREDGKQQHLEQTSTPVVTQTLHAEGSSESLEEKKSAKKSTTTEDSYQAVATHTPLSGMKAQAKVAPPVPTPTSAPAIAAAPSLAKSAAKANNTARGTIWPPEKKDQIAGAAARWLNALPENCGRTITAPQISQMLDHSPTYIELCKMIEKLGFKVGRAAFAKALLASVPGANANQSSVSPAIPRPPSTGPLRPPATSNPSGPIPGIQATVGQTQSSVTSPVQNNISSLSTYESPYSDSLGQPIGTTQQLSTTKQPALKHNHKASETKKSNFMDAKSHRPSETPSPFTKAEAARKRTFAELVDLSALSDDDELPPTKQSYFGPPPITQPGEAYSIGLDYIPSFQANTVIDPRIQQSVDHHAATNRSPSIDRQAMVSVANRLNTMELAKPIDRKNALRRSRYNIRTLARDVLLASGRHPDLLPLNGHLESLPRVFPRSIKSNSDLATVRWDLIDPGDPVPAALEAIANDDKDSVIDDADDESEEEERHFTVRAPSRSMAVGIGGYEGAGRTIQMDAPLNGFGRGKLVSSRGRGRPRGRPRDRPPGFARFSTGGAQTPIGNHRTPAPHSTSSPSSATGTGYSQFHREVRPDGTKRRGRPVGWRKHLHMKGVGVNAGGTGVPPTSSKQAPPIPAKEPKFMVYRCGWQDCGAQLHNLDTLRRHIKKKHGFPDKSGKYTCMWSDCGKRVRTTNSETGDIDESTQRFNFPDTVELMKHVEEKHVKPIAWALGDGPPGGFSDSNATDSEVYLSDRQGRRVTPTVAAAVPSLSTSPASRSGQRGRPPKKTGEEKAKEGQAALAKKKREIGLGVDREGATFANEKRRAGFVDDEDGDGVVVDASD